jgi:hypothetical protein
MHVIAIADYTIDLETTAAVAGSRKVIDSTLGDLPHGPATPERKKDGRFSRPCSATPRSA